jgi:glycosyltransferase involved in cell wall biosynthesis
MKQPQKLKVALLAYRDDWHSGGSLRVAHLLAEHLAKDAVEVHLVFAYGPPGPVSRQSSVPVHHLNSTSSRDWRSYTKVRRWFREMNFDVLHFIDAIHWLLFITVGLRSKRLLHFHGTPDPATMSRPNQLLGVSKRWLANAGIAITHGAKKGVARIGWMSPQQLHVIQNGVSVEYFAQLPTQSEARKQLGIPLDVNVMGAVARFNDGCGLMEVFDILQHLPEDWHVLLVGDGRIKPDLERRAAELKVSHRLHLPGMMDDVRPAYAAMDAVVMLARYQSFCLMLAEAMLARRPIVGLQGAGEYTEHQYPLITAENAKLIPREKPWDAFSQEPVESYRQVAYWLEQLVNDHSSLETQVETANAWVQTRFTTTRQAEQCLALYQALMGKATA